MLSTVVGPPFATDIICAKDIFHLKIVINITIIIKRMTERRSRRIPPALRKIVWDQNNDPSLTEGKCFVCKGSIHLLTYECGHIIAYAEGGKTVAENLRPLCSLCNKSMGKKNLNDYIKEYYSNSTNSNSTNSNSTTSNSTTSSSTTSNKTKEINTTLNKQITNLESSIKNGVKFKTDKNIAELFISAVSTIFIKPEISNTCQHILLSGKNKGHKCANKATKGIYCSRHVK